MASICLRYFLHVADSSPVYPRILFFPRYTPDLRSFIRRRSRWLRSIRSVNTLYIYTYRVANQISSQFYQISHRDSIWSEKINKKGRRKRHARENSRPANFSVDRASMKGRLSFCLSLSAQKREKERKIDRQRGWERESNGESRPTNRTVVVGTSRTWNSGRSRRAGTPNRNAWYSLRPSRRFRIR